MPKVIVTHERPLSALQLRDVLLELLAQLCENQELTRFMAQILQAGDLPMEEIRYDPATWILVTGHLRQALRGMRLTDFGNDVEEVDGRVFDFCSGEPREVLAFAFGDEEHE